MLIILSGNFGEVSDEEEQREWVRIVVKLQAMKSKLVLLMDLFYLLILSSQYRSCDNTWEVWNFVVFINKTECNCENVRL